jgi:DNA (cytosine-5)-methyltransferase 1
MTLRVMDLFCGAGGIAEGFRTAGFEVVGGADLDPDACATFALNFEGAEVIHGDLREASVRQQATALAGNADVVVGGPACQAFSQVRNHTRLIDDPRNDLYREFVEALQASRPAAFLMENVPGLDQMGVREQVVEDLALNGEYRVCAQLVDALDYGIPQTRRRILFLGVHHSIRVDPPTLEGTGASTALGLERTVRRGRTRYGVAGREELAHRLADAEDPAAVSAEQALGDLAGLRRGSRQERIARNQLPEPTSAYQRFMRTSAEELANVSVPRMTEDTAQRLSAIPRGGNYLDLDERLTKRFLNGRRWGQDNGSGRLSRRHYYAYRRLHPHIWSWTLNTKADSVYHYNAIRALSVREFARLQSFGDHFEFTVDPRRGDLPGRISGGRAHSCYRQAGNAVPPLLAAAAAAALQKTITGTAAQVHEAV